MQPFLDGWEFEVVPWTVEAAWPDFPKLAQRASNSANAVAEGLGETESALYVLQVVSEGASLEDACAAAAAVSHHPESMPGIHAVCSYYKSTDGNKYLMKLDNFRSNYGLTVRLGNAFLEAVGSAMPPKVSKCLQTFPLLRTACIATQSVATVVEDGVAVLLTRHDVKKFFDTKHLAASKELEELFESLDVWCEEVVENGSAKSVDANGVYFAFCIRCILFFLQATTAGVRESGVRKR